MRRLLRVGTAQTLRPYRSSLRTKEKTMDMHTSGAQTNDCEIFYVPYRWVLSVIAFVVGVAFLFGH